MIYEQYKRYEQRMELLAGIWKWIKKYYKTIILPPVCAIIALLAFLALIGTVIGPIECSDSVCGQPPEVDAYVFLSQPKFEYCGTDGEWSETPPSEVGEYSMRIVSKNGYGKLKYSQETAFVAIPAELKFDYNFINVEYGDESKYLSEGLIMPDVVNGHSIQNIIFDFEYISEDRTGVSVIGFNVINRKGIDVTSSYIHIPSKGEWSFYKKEVSVSSNNASKIYDGEPLVGSDEYVSAGALVQGDSLQISDRAEIANSGSTENSFVAQIVNENGKDVTFLYDINYVYGELSVTPRELKVDTSTAEKTYDGTPLNGGTKCTVVNDGLLSGHSLKVIEPATLTDAGKVINFPKIKITDSAGKDVSSNYNVSVNSGYLSVIQRPITVESGSASKICDEFALKNETFSIVSGELVSGHKINAEFDKNYPIYVGQYDNTFSCIIQNDRGADVTSNYNITYVNGALTINPVVLKFTTGSGFKTYDGSPLTSTIWNMTSGSLLNGHNYTGTKTTGSQLDAGESDNTIEVVVYDKKGNNVTDKVYKIITDYGTLQVVPRSATIKSGSAEKVYDGTPLQKRSWSFNRINNNSTTGLLVGHRPNLTFTGSQTKVGSSPNTFSAKILDSTNRDVTKNYDLTLTYGTLTVYEKSTAGSSGSTQDNSTKPESPSSSNSMFDGKSGQPAASKESAINTEPLSPDGSKIFAKYVLYDTNDEVTVYFREASYGDYNGQKWGEGVVYTVNIGSNPLFLNWDEVAKLPGVGNAKFKISLNSICPVLVPYYMRGGAAVSIKLNYNDVAPDFTTKRSQYESTIYTNVDLASLIKADSVANSLESKYRQFVYSNYLSIPNTTKQAMLEIADSKGISASDADVVMKVKKYIQGAAKYNLNIKPYPQDVDVAVYFLSVAKEGYCQHFASAATLMYRALGIPARYVTGFMSSHPGLDQEISLTGEEAHAWVEVYVDGIGWIPVEVTAGYGGSGEGGGEGEGVGGGGGGGGAANSEVTASLVVSAYSAEKHYDGRPFDVYEGDYAWISQGALLPGHRLVAKVEAKNPNMIAPGTSPTMFSKFDIVDSSGKDVSVMYQITRKTGKHTILKRPITIATASVSKVYDGTPLSSSEYWIVSGSLAEGEEMTVKIVGEITEVGQITPNVIVTIRKAGTNQVTTARYDVTVLPGTLTVKAP